MKIRRVITRRQITMKKSITTTEELKLVCRKIADVEALWRTSALQELSALKRAA